jgi:hypothetical protein
VLQRGHSYIGEGQYVVCFPAPASHAGVPGVRRRASHGQKGPNMYQIEIGAEVFYEARREDAYALARVSAGSSVTYVADDPRCTVVNNRRIAFANRLNGGSP